MEGTVRTVAFQSDIWVEAVEQLMKFLRGAGFDVDHSSLVLNRNRHPYVETYYFEAQDNNPGCTD